MKIFKNNSAIKSEYKQDIFKKGTLNSFKAKYVSLSSSLSKQSIRFYMLGSSTLAHHLTLRFLTP
jgi:hypothetical protein